MNSLNPFLEKNKTNIHTYNNEIWIRTMNFN